MPSATQYVQLDEGMPVLKPPSPQYVDSYCQAQQSGAVRSHAFLTPPPPRRQPSSSIVRSASNVGEGGGEPSSTSRKEAPRLFDSYASRPEPHDMSLFYEKLPGKRTMKQQLRRIIRLQRILIVLCAIQISCAVTFILTVKALPADFGKQLLLLVVCVALIAGCIGALGAWGMRASILYFFFITQCWTLTTVVSQLMRTQDAKTRSSIFCHEITDSTVDCTHVAKDTQIYALVVTCVVIYLSMFFADGLAESIQERVSQDNQAQIIRFVWLMRKKSFVGIHRFEDAIHQHFEELVELGYLKLKMG
mmetsp:Transcript_58608/g.96753  ORF Transcript_58608/g.96753 Transcript_58608/m.96753 type:complete len:305 (-) Transcript_58608:385-1299(-)